MAGQLMRKENQIRRNRFSEEKPRLPSPQRTKKRRNRRWEETGGFYCRRAARARTGQVLPLLEPSRVLARTRRARWPRTHAARALARLPWQLAEATALAPCPHKP